MIKIDAARQKNRHKNN